jgi:hypothetical protein
VNLAAFSRIDLRLDTLPNSAALIDQIMNNPENMNFALNVATVLNPGLPGGILQVTRVDTNLGYTWTSLGRSVGPEAALDFEPGNMG